MKKVFFVKQLYLYDDSCKILQDHAYILRFDKYFKVLQQLLIVMT